MSGTGVERPRSTRSRTIARFVLGATLIFTGVSHLSFGRTAFYAQVPPWLPVNADFVVIASNGGARLHPDWYLNLQAKPEAEVEVEGARIAVRAVTVDDDQRERLWSLARDTWRFYDSYQQRTDRAIPVVRLQRVGG